MIRTILIGIVLCYCVQAQYTGRGNCQRALEVAKQREAYGFVGVFVPSCDPDGSYSAKQVHGSTGRSWCTDPSGHIKLLSSRPGQVDIHCDCPRARFNAQRGNAIGTFVPSCKENGEYSAVQCHSSTGFCWCVDSNGVKLSEPVRARPNC